ncbi:uncharacterized protein LOC115086687 isoform X2 [Rhinatrema bivittatum]|uniref:uncharacterized protein LOC115086687 isoform X2 n=1 Tax=Rhinatrema bivittatum TaxID=194408 RepID=UPI001129B2E1|nr:uncharacterized protein LOC115086687 isoform X2 [Rhinatrema bivittatum]
MSRGAEVLEDNLEELLTFNDLFLDYFNAFLALPAFPVRLRYDPLLGKLSELDRFLRDPSRPPGEEPELPGYGATDEERGRTLEWLKQERWPPFKRTLLYLEYKLARLVLRRLDDRRPAGRHGICGYSRQSNCTAASSLPSHPSTAGLPQSTPSLGLPGMDCDLLLRLPSRARSMPADIGRLTRLIAVYQAAGSGQDVLLGYCAPLDLQDLGAGLCSSYADSKDLLVSESGRERTTGRRNGAAAEEFPGQQQKDHVCFSEEEFTHSLGKRRELEQAPQDTPGLRFALDEESSDSEGEEDASELLGSVKQASLQRLKEAALGTRAGMESFREFLQGTLGIYLLHFWIDCEDLRERTALLEANDGLQESQHLCAQLFRCIQDKYKFHLSSESQEQMRLAQEDPGLTISALSRSQYGALRRLRSYWVPRFLIHQQRTWCIREGLDPGSVMKTPSMVASDFMPCSDVVSSGPVSGARPARRVKGSRAWHGVLTPDGSESSRAPCSSPPPDPQGNVPKSLLMDKLLTALEGKRDTGCAFLHYLIRFESADKTHAFLLWRDLEELKAAVARQADRHYLQRFAWGIFNTYLLPNSACSVGLRSDASAFLQDLHGLLRSCPAAETALVFEPVARRVLAVLCAAWIRHLRHDVALFLEYCVPASDSLAPTQGTREDTQSRIRKRESSTGIVSQRAQGLRRKKKKPARTTQLLNPSSDPAMREDAENSRVSLKLLNIKTVFNAYKKTMQETESEELQLVLDLLQKLDSCQNSKAQKKQRDLMIQLLELDSTYSIEAMGPFPKDLSKKLRAEINQGKISNASLERVKKFLTSILADSFERFWVDVSEGLKECGVQPMHLRHDDWLRLDSLLCVIVSKMILRRLKIIGGKLVQGIRSPPTEEDKYLFSRSLQEASKGWPTLEILHFLKYLETYGPMEGMPLLENHLLFCLEVLKFKNAHQAMPDRTLLKKKVQVIRDCFLTTKFEPPLQITLDAEKFESAMRAVKHSLMRDFTSPTLFDELHEVLLNSLLPFWAGFRKTWQSQSFTSSQRLPVMRVQRLLKRRLAHFIQARDPPRLFHLPSIKAPPGDERFAQPRITYSFSISGGITLKVECAQETQGSMVSRKLSEGLILPPIYPEKKESSSDGVYVTSTPLSNKADIL